MLKFKGSWLYLICLFLLHISCSQQQEHTREIIYTVKDKFVPDSRTGIFDIDIHKKAGEYVLSGETDNTIALEAVLDSLERLSISYINNVRLLPEKQLGDRSWGIINISVSNIRKDPKHSSELVTQGILGTPVKLLKKKGSWYFIQTPDRYLGWVDGGGIELKSQDEINQLQNKEKVIFTEIYGFSYREPDINSPTISDLTVGNVLYLEDSIQLFYKVTYPDGRIGYLNRLESEILSEWIHDVQLDGTSLTLTAFKLTGIPYLWGGTSSKALDCSGLTKTVYFMHGLILPRDASQQEKIGVVIDEDKEFENLQEGDLLFFGNAATDTTRERVVHVGMWIGDMKFIHASGDVHVSSMDPKSSIFDEFNIGRYLRTRRLIGSESLNTLPIQKVYSENLF